MDQQESIVRVTLGTDGAVRQPHVSLTISLTTPGFQPSFETNRR